MPRLIYVPIMFRASNTPARPRLRLMLPDERRARFQALAIEQGASHVELSQILGRNDAYVSSYLTRGVPYDLARADQSKLARFFGVDEDTLKPRLARTRGER
jgi:hypothetical protein